MCGKDQQLIVKRAGERSSLVNKLAVMPLLCTESTNDEISFRVECDSKLLEFPGETFAHRNALVLALQPILRVMKFWGSYCGRHELDNDRCCYNHDDFVNPIPAARGHKCKNNKRCQKMIVVTFRHLKGTNLGTLLTLLSYDVMMI